MPAPVFKDVAYEVTVDEVTTPVGWVELLAGATAGSVTLIDQTHLLEVTIAEAAPMAEADVPFWTIDIQHPHISFKDLAATDKVYGRVRKRSTKVLVVADTAVELS